MGFDSLMIYYYCIAKRNASRIIRRIIEIETKSSSLTNWVVDLYCTPWDCPSSTQKRIIFMTTWNPDKYIDAWNFASVVHNGQIVPGTQNPYINHIGLVAMEAMAAVTNSGNINNPDLLVQCALLHDTIEDTECTYETINHEFDTEVADGVLALTKDGNLSTKVERM